MYAGKSPDPLQIGAEHYFRVAAGGNEVFIILFPRKIWQMNLWAGSRRGTRGRARRKLFSSFHLG